MEEKFSFKQDSPQVLSVILALSILNIVVSVISCMLDSNTVNITLNLFTLIISIVGLEYAVVSYKKPHGNAMKYLCLGYVIYVALCRVVDIENNTNLLIAISTSVMIIGATYMAGRLYKYQQNKIIIFILTIASLVYGTAVFKVGSQSFITFITSFSKLTIWIIISLAYTIRYKAHKEAGLEDKK